MKPVSSRGIHALLVIVAATACLLALALTAASAADGDVRPLGEGLTELEYQCPGRLQFRELRLEPWGGLEIRALRNSGARSTHQCPYGYGGPDLDRLATGVSGFELLGATNGNFFAQLGAAYVSTGFLWSRAPGGAQLLAPLTRKGSHVIVLDADGAHEVDLQAEETTESLVARLLASFPTMTLAAQLHMSLSDPGHYRCRRGDPAWRCDSLPRTVLCARADHSVSLLTTRATISELSEALRPGGSCHAACTLLYNLDGGGSTQLGYTDAETHRFVVTGPRVPSTNRADCGLHRPVDHYLIVGRPR